MSDGSSAAPIPTEGHDAAVSADRDEAFCEAYYDAHLTHALDAMREGFPYQINADGAFCLIQQAATDRRTLRAMIAASQGEGRKFPTPVAQAAYDVFFREGWMRGDIERFYRQGYDGISKPEPGSTPRAAVWWAGRDRASAGLPSLIPATFDQRSSAALSAPQQAAPVGDAVAWRKAADVQPEPGRKFVAIYDDGSGAWLGFAHDGGFIDADGDDHTKMPSAEWWAYLPSGCRLVCEDYPEEAFDLPDHVCPPLYAAPLADQSRLREALETVLKALDISRRATGCEPGDWPDFEEWEAKARQALAQPADSSGGEG